MELTALLDRLAEFEPTGAPFVSVYLDTRADEHGQDRFMPFVKKELGERARTYAERSPARQSFDRDAARILEYLGTVRADANGIAIFACSAADFFEALSLSVPIEQSEVVVAAEPHVYPLARLNDQYHRYAVLLTDTHEARIFIVGLGEIEPRDEVKNTKTRRSMAGGWSQARFQRHIDNYRLQHVKEVVDALDRVVRQERIKQIVLGGDETVLPMVREHLPKQLAESVVDVLSLDVTSPLTDVLRQTLVAMREHDAIEDAEHVERMLAAYRSGGLGVVGVEATRQALVNGQVHELLIAGAPDAVGGQEVVDELIAKARQTDARVRIIDDASIMEDAGGVGGLLRYRIGGIAA